MPATPTGHGAEIFHSSSVAAGTHSIATFTGAEDPAGGIAVGDQLFIAVRLKCSSSSFSLNIPTGWTVVANTSVSYGIGTCILRVYKRKANGSADDRPTVTLTSGGTWDIHAALHMFGYRGSTWTQFGGLNLTANSSLSGIFGGTLAAKISPLGSATPTIVTCAADWSFSEPPDLWVPNGFTIDYSSNPGGSDYAPFSCSVKSCLNTDATPWWRARLAATGTSGTLLHSNYTSFAEVDDVAVATIGQAVLI